MGHPIYEHLHMQGSMMFGQVGPKNQRRVYRVKYFAMVLQVLLHGSNPLNPKPYSSLYDSAVLFSCRMFCLETRVHACMVHCPGDDFFRKSPCREGRCEKLAMCVAPGRPNTGLGPRLVGRCPGHAYPILPAP